MQPFFREAWVARKNAALDTSANNGQQPPRCPAKHGDYSITVSAPVCGTGSSGSIPGSRPAF